MDWRRHLLDRLPGGDLVVADDVDGLLLEEDVQTRLRAQGYEVQSYGEGDPLAFRVLYEQRYREAGRLIVRTPDDSSQALPYDLIARGSHVRVGLDDLFPTLHYGTLRMLPLHLLDGVAAIAPDPMVPRLSEQQTIELVLRHVYGIDPPSIQTAEDLLRVLLRLHYRGDALPGALAAHLERLLRGKRPFEGWALDAIVPDRAAFFAFLQERWPLFVQAMAEGGRPESSGKAHDVTFSGFSVPGPALLPLGHEDLRVYVDNLFLEGHLHPIAAPTDGRFPAWLEAGIRVDPEQDRRRRLLHLLTVLEERFPSPDAPHGEWVRFAQPWGELHVQLGLSVGPLDEEIARRVQALRQRVDESFGDWVLQRFDSLWTQSARPPVMVHHIPAWLAHRSAQGTQRVALVVFDGMGMAQWAAMSALLEEQLDGVRLHTEGVFAWLPSITAVSRQASFTGVPPHYFATTLDRPDDEKGWERFWEGRGLPLHAVAYRNVKGEPVDLGAIEAVVDDHRIQALGLVVRKVDDIVHGSQLGLATTVSEVQQWVKGGWPARLIRRLIGAGFDLVITSDHGNVEAQGIGRPASGVRASGRGERVRVYDTAAARARDAAAVSGSVAWTPAGLPTGYEPLFAPPGAAFTQEGYPVVAHGGLSLDEVVVPLITTSPSTKAS